MEAIEKLRELKLISGKEIESIFEALYPDIFDIQYESESSLVNDLWSRYIPEKNVNNGAVLEGILATIFYRSGLLPLFIQAKLAFVPNVDFDFVIYSKEYGPIILSSKVSLRERYKQADLEGMILRHVHRKSESYLITLDESDANNTNNKIERGDVLGIDKVILATGTDFDELIKKLKTLTLYHPEKIEVIKYKAIINKI